MVGDSQELFSELFATSLCVAVRLAVVASRSLCGRCAVAVRRRVAVVAVRSRRGRDVAVRSRRRCATDTLITGTIDQNGTTVYIAPITAMIVNPRITGTIPQSSTQILLIGRTLRIGIIVTIPLACTIGKTGPIRVFDRTVSHDTIDTFVTIRCEPFIRKIPLVTIMLVAIAGRSVTLETTVADYEECSVTSRF